MEPRSELAISGKDPRRGHVLGVAHFERPVNSTVVRKRVVCATNFIVNVLAKLCRVWIVRVAHLKAEHPRTNKVNPFNDLSILLVICEVSTLCDLLERVGALPKGVGEDDTPERIALFVCAMWIEFCQTTSYQLCHLERINDDLRTTAHVIWCEADLSLV